MNPIPPRVSLVHTVAEALEQEIVRGTWNEWLPNERSLCETLQVSRNTLRVALAHLRTKKLVRPVHPRGTKILGVTPLRPRTGITGIVGLLSPQPLERLRPNVAVIIDELRAQLAETGKRLHIHHGERFFNPRSSHALQKLVESNRQDCWVLM